VELMGWVDSIPPLKQAMRYGNKAFRTWHARLARALLPMCHRLTAAHPSAAGAEVELAAYLVDAFGNSTRLDYGTGHETSFLVFLYCAAKVGIFSKGDLPALGLKVIPAYLRVVRKLQRTYWLEPAGSHGVWSLDDYQFVPFLLGSAQLLNHRTIGPRSIHSRELLELHASDYLYLAAVAFIDDVKTGAPFAEHSPILNDISELPQWAAVNDGLAKMYRAEVLGKLPVMQHMSFGSLFPASWTPSRSPVPSDGASHLYAAMAGAEDPQSPPGSDEVPVDHLGRAAAPWIHSPICTHSHPHSDTACGGGRPSPLLGGAHQTGEDRHDFERSMDTPAPWAEVAAISSVHEAFPGLKHVYAGPGGHSPGHKDYAGPGGRSPMHATGQPPSAAPKGEGGPGT